MQTVGFVVTPGFQMMSFAALSVFEFANVAAGEARYDVRVLSEDGGTVPSSMGIPVETRRLDRQSFDTVIFGGPLEPETAAPAVIAFAQAALTRSRRVASICTGAFLLAEAGMLDDRRATTHWFYARELKNRFPKIKVEEDASSSSTVRSGPPPAPAPGSTSRSAWWRRTWDRKSRATSRASSWSIIAGQADSPSTPCCWR